MAAAIQAAVLRDDIMEKRYVIGVDAGGTKVAYGLFDEDNKIVDRVQYNTDADSDGPEFSDTLIRQVNTLLTKNNITFDQLKGIGIGMPSFIERDTICVYDFGNASDKRFRNA